MISYGYPKASELGSLVIYGTMDSGKQRSREETNSINTKSNIDTEFKEGGGGRNRESPGSAAFLFSIAQFPFSFWLLYCAL